MESRSDQRHVEKRVRDVLAKMDIPSDEHSLMLDADLYDAGMTSHASVRLMLSLEETFDIEFPDELLQREVFASVASIVEAISSLNVGSEP